MDKRLSYSQNFAKIHPLYNVWQNMKRRCNNPNHLRYADWGGRGIKVCEKWNKSYQNFIEDVGMRPSPKHQLDRINNDGNYEPGNVRWTTASNNSINRRVKSSNKSGVSGVYFQKSSNKWHATITINKHRLHLGLHKTLISAINARKEAERLYF